MDTNKESLPEVWSYIERSTEGAALSSADSSGPASGAGRSDDNGASESNGSPSKQAESDNDEDDGD